jgi:hypothetical protein
MARIRSLKPEAFQSETLALVSVNAERTFLGLSTQVDDRGRIADKPAALNGELWAMRNEREPHTTTDFEAELDELVDVGLVCRYVGCDGKRYLHLTSFIEHQKVDKPSNPRTPRCPHHQVDDHCGKHGREPCPSTARPPQRTQGDQAPREPSPNPREGSGTSREPSLTDLGPRTVDKDQSVRVRLRAGDAEAARWLGGRYRLTDEESAAVMAEVRARARAPIEHLTRYIQAMDRGASADLADIVNAVTTPRQPGPGAEPGSPPLAVVAQWCGVCDELTRQAGDPDRPHRCPACHPLAHQEAS